MHAPRLRQALGLTLIGVVLGAAISLASAQGIVLGEEGLRVDVAMVEEEIILAPVVTIAQAPPVPAPAVTAEEAAATTPTTPTTLLSERAWPDEHTTIVECTGEAARTCQANVYGPGGEFILGRKIMPSGEAADCGGPCLDSTGAPLDASSVSRAQAAIAVGNRTFGIITSPVTTLPPAAEEIPGESEAERLHLEGN